MEIIMKKKIEVGGMSCGHCVMRIENALKENGINGAEVKVGEVVADFGGMSDADIKEIIESLGFDVISVSNI